MRGSNPGGEALVRAIEMAAFNRLTSFAVGAFSAALTL